MANQLAMPKKVSRREQQTGSCACASCIPSTTPHARESKVKGRVSTPPLSTTSIPSTYGRVGWGKMSHRQRKEQSCAALRLTAKEKKRPSAKGLPTRLNVQQGEEKTGLHCIAPCLCDQRCLSSRHTIRSNGHRAAKNQMHHKHARNTTQGIQNGKEWHA